MTAPAFQNCVCSNVSFYLKKQHFCVFVSSNIRNENKQVNKNHFLFCMSYLSLNKGSLFCPQYEFVKQSRISDWPLPFSKLWLLKRANFVKNQAFFNLWAIVGRDSIYSQIIYFNLFLSWFKKYQELCFVFFCTYVIVVLFCFVSFSTLQIWVTFSFLDSSGLCCVFDFNIITKIDRVLWSSDTKRTMSTEEC